MELNLMDRHTLAKECFVALLGRTYENDMRSHQEIAFEAYQAADTFLAETKTRTPRVFPKLLNKPTTSKKKL